MNAIELGTKCALRPFNRLVPSTVSRKAAPWVGMTVTLLGEVGFAPNGNSHRLNNFEHPKGTPGSDRSDDEQLDRFPLVLTSTADIATHQLGWRAAVLPFRNVGQPVGFGIALGMAEEISAALSRFRTPRMIAPVTFWDGTGPAADSFSRCRLYRLDYVVDSSIHVEAERVEVSVTLSDVILDYEVIWTGRFEGSLDDLFTLQNKIATSIIIQLDPDLHQREQERLGVAATRETKVALAHQSVLTAMHWIYRLERSKFMRARELLERAIELDPSYAAAHAWIAYWGIIAVGPGWVSDPQELTIMAGASADKAVSLDPQDARALAIAGHVKAYILQDVRAALQLHAQATALAPNLSMAWALSSWSRLYNGEHLTAIRHAKMAQLLSPRDPHIYVAEHAMVGAYLFCRQLDQADMLGEAVLARDPQIASALNFQLAILGHMGRTEDAADCLRKVRGIYPNVSISSILARMPLQPDDRDYYALGLRLAGVPDTCE